MPLRCGGHHLRLVAIRLSAPGTGTGTGAGSGMHEVAPLPPYSNERNNGPSSSQPASRWALTRPSWAAAKSGARKGLASCRETMACGTTARRAAPVSRARPAR